MMSTYKCTETTENPFKFTGQWFDSEIGQYYLRARMYDPVFMRFTSRDPVSGKPFNPLTLHKYLYCLNEPINHTDPSGRMTSTELVVTTAIEGGLMGALGGGIEGIIGELYDWSKGEEFDWGDVGMKTAVGFLAGMAFGAGEAVILGSAVRNLPNSLACFNLAVGIAQGVALDIMEKQKGGGGLRKLDAGVTLHNISVNAMLVSVEKGW